MWNDLIFNNQAMLRALETAGIKLNPPVHVIKAGKSHLSSNKVIFYIFNTGAARPELILKVGRNPGDLPSMKKEFDSTTNRLAEHATGSGGGQTGGVI